MNTFVQDSISVDRLPREDDDDYPDILDYFEDNEVEDSGPNSRFLDIEGYTLGLGPVGVDSYIANPYGTSAHGEPIRYGDLEAPLRMSSKERFSLVLESNPDHTEVNVWIIGCVVGKEEHAAAMISEKYGVGDTESLVTALAVPTLDGYVVVCSQGESIPADVVAQLYTINEMCSVEYPGTIYVQRLNTSPTFRTLESCLFPKRVSAGNWCRLRFPKSLGRRRLYDNEAALVVEVNQQYALVLLAPLIPWNMINDDSLWKRRRFGYVKMLFDETQLYEEYCTSILTSNNFESGLWLHRVPLRNIHPVDEDYLTESEFMTFANSAHTAIFAYFPRVLGWDFREGEVVCYWWDEHTKGVIKKITGDGLTVIDHIEPKIEYQWGWAARKHWNAGDEVSCPDGYEGIVQSAKGGSVEVWDFETPETRKGVWASRFYHANTLNPWTRIPSIMDGEVNSVHRQLCPWRFLPVRVTHGPAKGYHTVVDISRGDTGSGYVVVVQASVLNNRMIRTVDYSFVVCDKTGWPLHKVRSGKGWEFDFPLGYEHPHQQHPSIAPPWIRHPAVTIGANPVVVGSSTDDGRRTPPPTLDRHPSQLWLWELETCGLSFPVTVEMEEKLWKVNLMVERADEAFTTKKISFARRGVAHVLHYLTEVETKPITKKINKPFFVTSGEHKGEVLARLKGSLFTILSIRVNIFTGTIPEPHELRTVRIEDCCQMNMDEANWKKLETALDILRLEYA